MNRYQLIRLGAVFKAIYDQFITRFGFSEAFLDQINKRKQIALLKIDRMVSGDKSIRTLINIAEQELKAMSRQTSEAGFYEMKGSLEQQLGFAIDPRRTSVAEFYSYFKLIDKHGRKRQSKA